MKNFEIDFSDIEQREKVDAGSFGSVYLGLWKSQKKEIAIKRFEKPSNKNEQKVIEFMKKFENEVEMLSACNHLNIIQFYGACTTQPSDCYIITGIYIKRCFKFNESLQLTVGFRLADPTREFSWNIEPNRV